MVLHEERKAYRSYLLRCWRVTRGGHDVLRVLLREVGTDITRVFEDVDVMMHFLEEEVGCEPCNKESDKS